MVLIEGGSYPIGSAHGRESTRPGHTVTLDPFLIDVYEVTNAQFAAFLNTLRVTAKRDVRAGELRPDDVEGPGADRLWGGSNGNDRAFIEMDDTDARIGIVDGRTSRYIEVAVTLVFRQHHTGWVSRCKHRSNVIEARSGS